jgi:hypothetical protein
MIKKYNYLYSLSFIYLFIYMNKVILFKKIELQEGILEVRKWAETYLDSLARASKNYVMRG